MEGSGRWPMLLLLLLLVLVAVSLDISKHFAPRLLTFMQLAPSPASQGSMSADGVDGTRQPEHQVKSGDSSNSGDRPSVIPLVLKANLSACNPTFTEIGRPVYCCPSEWKNGDQEIVDFQLPDPATTPMRIRRPIHKLDAEHLAKFERGVALMRQLPTDHPHSHARQAGMHCLYCTGSYNQANSSLRYRVHRSWLFFPWHRAYIYFYERIIAKLIDDDDFTLPYWAWDHPDAMWFQDIFNKGAFHDPQRDPIHLADMLDVAYECADKGLSNEDQVSVNKALMYHQVVSAAKKPELFMGCRLKAGYVGLCEGQGTLEVSPHNTVHGWVGNRNNPEYENMGAFYSAARDPSFFPHHSNIDRIWTVWKTIHGERLEFDDEEWLNSEFTFFDENLRLVRIRVRDLLTTTNLRYKYEDIDIPWLGARPKPSVPPHVARQILKAREDKEGASRMLGEESAAGDDGRSISLPGAAQQQGNWTLDRSVTVKVDRPRTTRTPQEKEEEEEILYIYGIDSRQVRFVKFDVYVNVVEQTVLSPTSREFAGTYVNIHHLSSPSKSPEESETGRKMVKPHLKIGISELLEDLEAEKDETIWVTLVPSDTTVKTKIEGMRIEFMKW